MHGDGRSVRAKTLKNVMARNKLFVVTRIWKLAIQKAFKLIKTVINCYVPLDQDEGNQWHKGCTVS